MKGCLVDHPLIAAAADELAEAARDLGIAAHDEERKRLGLRAVWLRTNGTQVLATLVTSEANEVELVRLSPRLTLCDGVAFSFHREGGNALRGAEATVLRGIDALDVHGTRIGPLGFLAARTPRSRSRCTITSSRASAADGSSTSTPARVQPPGRLRAVASGSRAVRVAPLKLRAISASKRKRRNISCTRQTEAPDAVVANPPSERPRRRCDQRVAPSWARLAFTCWHVGRRGLSKDIAALAQAYRLESLRAYDTLPQTPHVELVAKLVRL